MTKFIEKISKQLNAVKRKPKWQFIIQKTFIWGALIVAVILGAVAVSMIFFQLLTVEWGVLRPRFGVKELGVYFGLIPYFWILVAGILLTFVYFDFRKTKSGYKYSGVLVVVFALIISIILGTILYLTETSIRVEDFFQNHHFYQRMHDQRQGFWFNPESGLLGGEIVDVKDQGFTLIDPESMNWMVDASEIDSGLILIAEGNMVKIIGTNEGPHLFKAKEVRPWNIYRKSKVSEGIMFGGPFR